MTTEHERAHAAYGSHTHTPWCAIDRCQLSDHALTHPEPTPHYVIPVQGLHDLIQATTADPEVPLQPVLVDALRELSAFPPEQVTPGVLARHHAVLNVLSEARHLLQALRDTPSCGARTHAPALQAAVHEHDRLVLGGPA